LYRAGITCLRILPLITAGLLLSGCFGSTLTTIGPLQIKQSDLLTAPIKIAKVKEKTNE